MATPTQVNSTDAGSLFTVTSLLTLQGSALAASVVPNVLLILVPALSQSASNWLAFAIAMGLSLLAARQASGPKSALFWAAAVLNGFLIFAAAIGLELGASQASEVV